MKLSVIIPCFNEAGTIAEIVRRVQASPYTPKEIVVVDDGSSDGSQELLRSGVSGVHKVVLLECNQGKGAALRAGLAAISGDVVVFQDADLEYDPTDYERLIQPILDDRADVVFGSRFLGSKIRMHSAWQSIANRFITFASNMLTNLNLSDIETGYKMFRREVLEAITIEEDGFGIEPELTAKIARMNVRIAEVGISYDSRTYGQGKKIGWKDGVEALYCIARYNLWPSRRP